MSADNKKAASSSGETAQSFSQSTSSINNRDIIDKSEAEKFLQLLSGGGSVTFQTFDDRPKKDSKLTKVIHGTLNENFDQLKNLNQHGAGIFITVNATDLKGRKTDNIKKVRAFFVDLDGAPIDPILEAPLKPHIIVESSPGRFHAYWLVSEASLDIFSKVQKALIAKFNGDKSINDLARVMRLPGFMHQKQEAFMTAILEIEEAPLYSVQDVIQKLALYIEEKMPDEKTAGTIPDKNVEDEILGCLKSKGLYSGQNKNHDGAYEIICPWASEHSNDDGKAYYYPPNTGGYSGSGFKCFHSHCAGRSIFDLKKFLNILELPEPLFPNLVSAMPFPIDSLGETLGKAARSLADIIQAPDALCGQCLLAAASLLAQGLADINVDGRSSIISLYFVSIAQSGERKSTLSRIILKPIVEYQEKKLKEFRIEKQKYRLAQKQWEEYLKNSEEELDFSSEPICPPLPMYLTSEPTFDGLIKLLKEGMPAVGLFSDEAAILLGGHSFKEDNFLRTIGGFSSLWDHGSFDRVRKGDDIDQLYGKRLSMHLMVQNKVADKVFSNEILVGQGFLSRCLISCPPSTIGTRFYKEINLGEDEALKNYYSKAKALLNFKLPMESQDKKLTPRDIFLSDGSKELWKLFYNQLEEGQQDDGIYSSVRDFASKAAEHSLRVAAVVKLFEDPNSVEIDVDTISSAIYIVKYYLNERLRFANYINVDTDLLKAQGLLDWLKRKQKSIFPISEVLKSGPGFARKKKEAVKFLKILQDYKQLFFLGEGVLENQKHKELWKMNEEGAV